MKDLIDKRRREHERAVARHAIRQSPLTWRMKLRVRLVSKLNTEALEVKTSFQGRRVLIRARRKGKPLKESEWVIFLARRFRSIEAAAEFGIALQSAISAIAAVRCIPIDVGVDNLETSSVSEVVKAAMAKKGLFLIDDVHGVDVYPDTQTAMVAGGDATVTVSLNPNVLTRPLEQMGRALGRLDDRGREAALLINSAYMAPHPVAMLTLGVAAVELLAAGERWNAAQLKWIASLHDNLHEFVGINPEEKLELGRSIDSLRTMGALSRTRRLISDLGLEALLPRWEKLYRKRSRPFMAISECHFPSFRQWVARRGWSARRSLKRL